MKKFLFGLVFASLVTPVFASGEPFEGFWAADPAWCNNTSGDTLPIEIRNNEIRGYENTCQITNAVSGGDLNFWYLELGCSGEGESYSVKTLFMLDGASTMYRWYGDGEPLKFTRCNP